MKTRIILTIIFTFIVTLTHSQSFYRLSTTEFFTYNFLKEQSLLFGENFQKVTSNDKSSEKRGFLVFGHEKGGAVCINGLEKFEIAAGSFKKPTALSQLHFYGPLNWYGL